MEKTLRQWHNEYHENDEYQQLFYLMDYTMRFIHNSNFYISKFDYDRIIIGEEEGKDSYVAYQDIDPILDEEMSFEVIEQNKVNFTLLQIGLYSDTISYAKDNYLSFVRENFDQFLMFVPEEDVNYFKSMILYDGHIYYSDYCDARNQQELTNITKSLEEDGGNSMGKSFNKSTVSGRVASQLYQLSDESNNMAAFVQHYILPFIIIFLSMLIPLLSWFFALS